MIVKHSFIVKNILFTATLTILFTSAFSQEWKETGVATYYGKAMNGARVASGIRLNNDSLVCAHRTLPFGTLIKVTNSKNGKSVIVKVIDRGPFVKGRVIDLSFAAADSIGMLRSGLANVTLEKILK